MKYTYFVSFMCRVRSSDRERIGNYVITLDYKILGYDGLQNLEFELGERNSKITNIKITSINLLAEG